MIKVAVVGVGHLGKQHARLYASLTGAQLIGIVDSDAGRAAEIASLYGVQPFADYRELYGKAEAVSLAVPTVDHARIAVDLLEHGMDVLVEKPISVNTEEARTMIDCAARHNQLLQVGHVERFNPVVAMAREVATQPQFFEIHRLSMFSPRSLDIDVVLDLMIHDLDIVLSLVRSPIREVRAVGIPVLSGKADIANARVEFEDGCVANLTASRVSSEKMRKLRFFQPNDYISIDYSSQRGALVSLRMGRVMQRKLEPPVDEPLKIELESFLHAVRTRKQPVVSGEDGLKALDLAIRINKEIETHRQNMRS